MDAGAVKGLMKSPYLLRCPHPESLRRTCMYASFLGISGALYLWAFDQPACIRPLEPSQLRNQTGVKE
jgi:hypothetical protein